MADFVVSSELKVMSFRVDEYYGPYFAVREFDSKVIRADSKRRGRGGPSEQAIRASIRQGSFPMSNRLENNVFELDPFISNPCALAPTCTHLVFLAFPFAPRLNPVFSYLALYCFSYYSAAILNMALKSERANKDEIAILKSSGILGKRAPSCSLLSAEDTIRLLIAFGKDDIARDLAASVTQYRLENPTEDGIRPEVVPEVLSPASRIMLTSTNEWATLEGVDQLADVDDSDDDVDDDAEGSDSSSNNSNSQSKSRHASAGSSSQTERKSFTASSLAAGLSRTSSPSLDASSVSSQSSGTPSSSSTSSIPSPSLGVTGGLGVRRARAAAKVAAAHMHAHAMAGKRNRNRSDASSSLSSSLHNGSSLGLGFVDLGLNMNGAGDMSGEGVANSRYVDVDVDDVYDEDEDLGGTNPINNGAYTVPEADHHASSALALAGAGAGAGAYRLFTPREAASLTRRPKIAAKVQQSKRKVPSSTFATAVSKRSREMMGMGSTSLDSFSGASMGLPSLSSSSSFTTSSLPSTTSRLDALLSVVAQADSVARPNGPVLVHQYSKPSTSSSTSTSTSFPTSTMRHAGPAPVNTTMAPNNVASFASSAGTNSPTNGFSLADCSPNTLARLSQIANALAEYNATSSSSSTTTSTSPSSMAASTTSRLPPMMTHNSPSSSASTSAFLLASALRGLTSSGTAAVPNLAALTVLAQQQQHAAAAFYNNSSFNNNSTATAGIGLGLGLGLGLGSAASGQASSFGALSHAAALSSAASASAPAYFGGYPLSGHAQAHHQHPALLVGGMHAGSFAGNPAAAAAAASSMGAHGAPMASLPLHPDLGMGANVVAPSN